MLAAVDNLRETPNRPHATLPNPARPCPIMPGPVQSFRILPSSAELCLIVPDSCVTLNFLIFGISAVMAFGRKYRVFFSNSK